MGVGGVIGGLKSSVQPVHECCQQVEAATLHLIGCGGFFATVGKGHTHDKHLEHSAMPPSTSAKHCRALEAAPERSYHVAGAFKELVAGCGFPEKSDVVRGNGSQKFAHTLQLVAFDASGGGGGKKRDKQKGLRRHYFPLTVTNMKLFFPLLQKKKNCLTACWE